MAYDKRNGNRPQRRDAPREFFKATCADCGKECEIPFRPTEGRPVYCRDCYRNHRPADSRPRRHLF